MKYILIASLLLFCGCVNSYKPIIVTAPHLPIVERRTFNGSTSSPQYLTSRYVEIKPDVADYLTKIDGLQSCTKCHKDIISIKAKYQYVEYDYYELVEKDENDGQ